MTDGSGSHQLYDAFLDGQGGEGLRVLVGLGTEGVDLLRGTQAVNRLVKVFIQVDRKPW